MYKKIILVWIAVFIAVAAVAQDARKYTTHVVRTGETLKQIAKKYKCKVKEIKGLNPDIDKDNLPVNTTLVVPNNNPKIKQETPKKETPKPEKVVIHTVKPGNTVFSIAKEYNVTMQALREANKLTSDDLQPGQQLRIPSQAEFTIKPNEKNVVFYLVQKGDTKWRIAQLHNITVSRLEELNPELRDAELKENMNVWVPAKKELESEVIETYQQERDSTFIYHVVKEGEGLFRIAVMYETTQEEIEILNPEAVKKLRPGMLLKIPGKKKDKYVTHTVENGDTFYSLTRKYDVTEEQLIALNPNLEEGLKEGIEIFIKPAENKDIPMMGYPDYYEGAYSVSFLMPMFSEKDVNLNNNDMDSYLRKIVVDFYMGAQLAIENLQSKGMQVNYHVFDTKNDPTEVENLMKNPLIKNADAIIGPFFFDNAVIVADNLKKTPVISPIYSKKQSKNNHPNLLKTGISPSGTLNYLVKYITDNYQQEKVVIIADKNPANVKDAEKLEQSLSLGGISYQKILPTSNAKNPDAIYMEKESMENSVSVDKPTWVILFSDDSIITSDVISTYGVSALKNEIKLFTLKEFSDYEHISINYLGKMKWAFPAIQFSELDNSEVNEFKKVFENQYLAPPKEYAFSGYDITYDVLSRLSMGNFFENVESLSSLGLSRMFKYQQEGGKDFKNSGIFMVQMNDRYHFEVLY
jgi:LysM repeat protein